MQDGHAAARESWLRPPSETGGGGPRIGAFAARAPAPASANRGTETKKRGRSGLERPKSREETPKEGYDMASRAREVASQNLRVHCTIFKCNSCRAAHTETKGWAAAAC